MEAARASEIASGWIAVDHRKWIAVDRRRLIADCKWMWITGVSHWSHLAGLCNLNYNKQKQTEAKEH